MSILNNGLSIGIPTYNRKDALIHLLKSIECQNYNRLYEIIICDNASPYDVETVIKESVSPAFFSKCSIIKNGFNIGGPANVKNQFLFCRSKWFWLIGDDDEITNDALDIVFNDIDSDPDCAYFKYTTKLSSVESLNEDDVRIDNLQDFIKYGKIHSTGNLVFMSNNIFNMEKLARYLPIMMTYNTSVPQCVPMLIGLDSREIYVRFSSKAICYYIAPKGGVQWNMLRVMLAISSLQDIPFKSLKKNEIFELLEVFKLMPFRLVCGWCVRNKNKVGNFNQLQRVYYSIYKKPFSFLNYILLLLCKFEFLYKINILSFVYKHTKHS